MANIVKVDVKWKKDLFKDIEIDFDQSPDDFRAKLFSLSNVPPENQKFMLRGGVALKDDWAPFIGKIKSGQQIMMMGNAAENLAQAPEKPIVFTEDVTESNEPVYDGPPGIVNLGNTCYMNASLQCLNAIPEIRHSLANFNGQQSDEIETNITRGTKDLFTNLNNNKKAVEPVDFLVLFRSSFPQFAEMKNGKYTQQDAEEFWTQLLNCLRRLPRLENAPHIPGSNIVDQLFEIGLLEELSCVENPYEPKISKHVTVTKLQCHIGGKPPTSHLLEGVELSFHEQIEKFSPSLSKSCIYQKTAAIDNLPFYLTVQFVRFFWKKTEEKKVKIVRPVDFPMTLDLFKQCTPSLQARLLPNRLTPEEKEKGVSVPTSSDVQPLVPQPYVNSTGVYELYAVVTHQGVYADGGHYVGWARQSADPNDWLEFDDKEVTPRKEEDIKKLNGSGGAQWHIAYMCLYRSKTT